MRKNMFSAKPGEMKQKMKNFMSGRRRNKPSTTNASSGGYMDSSKPTTNTSQNNRARRGAYANAGASVKPDRHRLFDHSGGRRNARNFAKDWENPRMKSLYNRTRGRRSR